MMSVIFYYLYARLRFAKINHSFDEGLWNDNEKPLISPISPICPNHDLV
jgi:hypothetical protein